MHALHRLSKMIGSDMGKKLPAFDQLKTEEGARRKVLRAKEETALASRMRMRELERER